MFKNEQNRVKKRPIISNAVFIIFYVVGLLSVIVYRVSLSNPAAADFFRDTLGFALRFILTRATYYIPFSLAEILLLASLPAVVVILVIFIGKIKRSDNKLRVFLRGLSRFAAFLCVIMFLFTFTLGVGYGATPIHADMGLERRLISADDLVYAMRFLVREANKEAENICYNYICPDTGGTLTPYGLNELSAKLYRSFVNLRERYNFVRPIRARVKPIIISEVFSRMRIAGVYSFFTGEANINILPPDYNLPFTAAHEMAHLMGISREDEANFAAFLATLHSGGYIRYGGLVQMIQMLRPALRSADREAYLDIMGGLSAVIRNDLYAQSRFWERYSADSPAARMATAVNDTYLRAHARGRDESERHMGVATYGLARDMAVIYLREFYGR